MMIFNLLKNIIIGLFKIPYKKEPNELTTSTNSFNKDKNQSNDKSNNEFKDNSNKTNKKNKVWSFFSFYIGKWFELYKNNAIIYQRYNFKLIGWMSLIIVMFIICLMFLIYNKTVNGIDPLLITLDTNTFIGKVANNRIFCKFANLLFGYWNFGPSYETLLGLIIIVYIILMLINIISTSC